MSKYDAFNAADLLTFISFINDNLVTNNVSKYDAFNAADLLTFISLINDVVPSRHLIHYITINCVIFKSNKSNFLLTINANAIS